MRNWKLCLRSEKAVVFSHHCHQRKQMLQNKTENHVWGNVLFLDLAWSGGFKLTSLEIAQGTSGESEGCAVFLLLQLRCVCEESRNIKESCTTFIRVQFTSCGNNTIVLTAGIWEHNNMDQVQPDSFLRERRLKVQLWSKYSCKISLVVYWSTAWFNFGLHSSSYSFLEQRGIISNSALSTFGFTSNKEAYIYERVRSQTRWLQLKGTTEKFILLHKILFILPYFLSYLLFPNGRFYHFRLLKSIWGWKNQSLKALLITALDLHAVAEGPQIEIALCWRVTCKKRCRLVCNLPDDLCLKHCVNVPCS